MFEILRDVDGCPVSIDTQSTLKTFYLNRFIAWIAFFVII